MAAPSLFMREKRRTRRLAAHAAEGNICIFIRTIKEVSRYNGYKHCNSCESLYILMPCIN